MHVTTAFRLPLDLSSVPFARGLCRSVLEHLQVDRTAIDDIALAVTEACANVVLHAHAQDDYEVRVDIDDDLCRITISDAGTGFDPAISGNDPGSVLENGRGLFLMRSLVDELHFSPGADGGMSVQLDKRLPLGEHSPVHALLALPQQAQE